MNILYRKSIKLVALLKSHTYRSGLRFGTAAAIEHEAIVGSLKIDQCIDVGANVGQFSLMMRKVHPQCKIIAFEPLSAPAATYNQVFRDDELTRLYPYAVGVEAASVSMNVSASNDSSSLLEITEMQSTIYPRTEKSTCECVTVKPLSAFLSLDDISSNSFLKIDVQGFELEVLKGTKDILKNIRWVYAELSFQELYSNQPMAHEIIEYLIEKKFILIGVHNMVFDDNGRSVQGDFLFTSMG